MINVNTEVCSLKIKCDTVKQVTIRNTVVALLLESNMAGIAMS
jgi:hypothetical protein